jgi:hypothetical protein
MPRSSEHLLGELHDLIMALPDVFSAVQWGGRAYKLPRPDGSTKKPRLLAFVTLKEQEGSIHVGFKLPLDKAAEAVDRYAWLEPSTFGSHGKSGWVDANITQKRQLKPLGKLIAACRETFVVAPPAERSQGDTPAASVTTSDAGRIDRLLDSIRADGWSPPEDDDFADLDT